MKAVIMAGGGGTRLRPLTCDLPKPMVPILNSPMMEHIVNLLKRYDLTRLLVPYGTCLKRFKIIFGWLKLGRRNGILY